MSQYLTGLSEHEKKGTRRGRRLLRPKEAQQRLGISRTTFWDGIIGKGRLRLVRLGPKIVAVVEDELDALIEQMIAERDAAPPKPQAPARRPGRPRKTETSTETAAKA